MKLNTYWLKWATVCAVSSGLAVITGCGGGGGSGGSTAARNPDPVEITSLRTGVPVCSTLGNGSLNGTITPGISATLTTSPLCSDPAASTLVWFGINTADTNVVYYDWEIVNWKSQAPHGSLDRFGEVIDIDPVNGRYIVRSHGNSTVRYVSATASQLASLTQPFVQHISVTAWTADGRYGSASFTITIQPGTTAVSSIIGSLTSTDARSHGRAGHFADFYAITGAGSTTLKAFGFDTYLYVYDASLNLVAEKDEGADNGGSQLSVNLQSGQTYYVEVTSYAPNTTGNYVVSSTAGGLRVVNNPWTSTTAPNIAGNYNVSENTTITIIYNGITTTTNAVTTRNTTVTQNGSSFSFPAVDPTGMLPTTTRYGFLNGNAVTLTGEPFIPANPGISVTSNSQTSSGTVGNNQFTLTTTAQLQGTYKGLPLTAQIDSAATFAR